MNKKLILAFVMTFLMLFTIGCTKTETKNILSFKEEYETVNDQVLTGSTLYRTITIDENNPYKKVELEDIVQKLDNNETFYLYVGDPLCPWCRSGLEKMIEVANKEGIKEIYYIDFWDDNRNEILRDKYELQNGELVKTQNAKNGYDRLLSAVENFAQDYTLKAENDDVIYVGEKRIFGGDHFYFENGICKRYVSLRSDKLEKSDGELTEEVLADQEKNFSEFFGKSVEPGVCIGEENC